MKDKKQILSHGLNWDFKQNKEGKKSIALEAF